MSSSSHNTPRVFKAVHPTLSNIKTPEDPVQLPWDPRSPLLNRTPINLIEPMAVSPSSSTPIAPVVHAFNPLDPRSPLLTGNRTPIPMDDNTSQSNITKENESNGITKQNKESKGARKKKVVVMSHNKSNDSQVGVGECVKGSVKVNQNTNVTSMVNVSNTEVKTTQDPNKKSPIKRQIAFFDATNMVDS
eukprot:TRINITY_DN284_c1_g1_i3.p2 TRINITY_DN284_c1_g1~~TRINITY_DN284_c1_g1_i3.p2  ORF type:complete len:190 (+),score=45.81 TRINITY_DN284_c1_g1_i3:377-946(+)